MAHLVSCGKEVYEVNLVNLKVMRLVRAGMSVNFNDCNEIW